MFLVWTISPFPFTLGPTLSSPSFPLFVLCSKFWLDHITNPELDVNIKWFGHPWSENSRINFQFFDAVVDLVSSVDSVLLRTLLKNKIKYEKSETRVQLYPLTVDKKFEFMNICHCGLNRIGICLGRNRFRVWYLAWCRYTATSL